MSRWMDAEEGHPSCKRQAWTEDRDGKRGGKGKGKGKGGRDDGSQRTLTDPPDAQRLTGPRRSSISRGRWSFPQRPPPNQPLPRPGSVCPKGRDVQRLPKYIPTDSNDKKRDSIQT